MHTAYITHAICHKHFMGHTHPETPARLTAIGDRLHASHIYDYLRHHDAPMAHRVHLARVHDTDYIDRIEAASPYDGMIELDGDTIMNPHTLDAAYHSAGAGILAVDWVMKGEVENAFIACRPPGHHATRNQSMGFCLFNNVAVAAAHALDAHGLERVAIIDFDVHHGNGTEDIFKDDPRVLFVSSFQHPFWPHCGADTVSDHIVNIPLKPGTTGKAYRELFETRALPALEAFKPQFVFVSAGFDAHREDDMSHIGLVEADYVWITEQLMDIAKRHASDRLVSILEGGYDLSSLGRSAAAHVKALAGL